MPVKILPAIFLTTFCCSLVSFSAQADIVLSATRIIYNEGAKDVTIRLENKGQKPLLTQSWLDDGHDNADPSALKVPFNATPPVSRIEPKQGQTVRLMFNGSEVLPKDRESVYWFNVLEVPPKMSATDAQNKNLLQLAFRTRIKLFYRPQGLEGKASDAPAHLKWQQRNVKGKTTLQVTNPTPYFVSFNVVNIVVNGKKIAVLPVMAPPKGSAEMVVTNAHGPLTNATVEYLAINDFGSAIKGSVSL